MYLEYDYIIYICQKHNIDYKVTVRYSLFLIWCYPRQVFILSLNSKILHRVEWSHFYFEYGGDFFHALITNFKHLDPVQGKINVSLTTSWKMYDIFY